MYCFLCFMTCKLLSGGCQHEIGKSSLIYEATCTRACGFCFSGESSHATPDLKIGVLWASGILHPIKLFVFQYREFPKRQSAALSLEKRMGFLLLKPSQPSQPLLFTPTQTHLCLHCTSKGQLLLYMHGWMFSYRYHMVNKLSTHPAVAF